MNKKIIFIFSTIILCLISFIIVGKILTTQQINKANKHIQQQSIQANSNKTTQSESRKMTNNEDTQKDQDQHINKAGRDFSEFIPKGWHFIKRYDYNKSSLKDVIIEGDLNKDDIPDKVAVIEGTSIDNDEDPPRALIVAFGNKDKTYTLSIKTENAILKSHEGGTFGDPFNKISIDRGSLLIDFYGGSSSRWNNIYRFRYQDNGWYLIGATEIGIWVTEDPIREETEDYNLLTGDLIKTETNEEGKKITTKINRGKKQLVNLKDFKANSEEKQF